MTARHPLDDHFAPPERVADGTQPGTERLIGQRCSVWYTDTTGKLPLYVLRIGSVAGIEPDGRVRVRLPWGVEVTATAQEVEALT